MCSQIGCVMISLSSLVFHTKVKTIALTYWIVLHFAYHITPSDLCQSKGLVSLLGKCWYSALVFTVIICHGLPNSANPFLPWKGYLGCLSLSQQLYTHSNWRYFVVHYLYKLGKKCYMSYMSNCDWSHVLSFPWINGRCFGPTWSQITEMHTGIFLSKPSC